MIVGDDFPVEGIDGLNLPNELDYVRISAVSYYFKFLSLFQRSVTSSNLLLMLVYPAFREHWATFTGAQCLLCTIKDTCTLSLGILDHYNSGPLGPLSPLHNKGHLCTLLLGNIWPYSQRAIGPAVSFAR